MRAPDTLPPEIEADLAAMDAAVAGRPHPDGDPLLAELAALVAEVRPEPDPDWARSLDIRRRQGFSKHAPFQPGRPRARRGIARLRPPGGWGAPALGLAACALIALVIGLAGSGGGEQFTAGGGSSGSASAGGGSTAASDAAPEAGGSGAASGDSSAALAPQSITPATGGDPKSDGRSARKVERAAAMTLGARRRDIDTVADGAARVATTLGGFVASSSVSSRNGGELDLRVPAARLDDAVARLSRLAHVRRLERSTLDITAQSVSARARVTELKAERRSLVRQLARAATLDEIDRLRARIHTVDNRLQAARATAQRVDNRAAYANLTVQVVAERRAAAAPAGGWSPRDAWHDALRVLEVAAGIALIAFAVALPLVLLGAPAWVATRRLTRRRRERALDLA
jgi:Domain of unknown function (DUF4349)